MTTLELGEIAAWIATGGGAVTILVAKTGFGSGTSDGTGATDKWAELGAVGLAIVALLAERAAPPLERRTDQPRDALVLGNLGPVADRRRHDATTLDLYRHLLAPRVRAVVAQLLTAAAIDGIEANRLLTPTTLGEIEMVGVRLLDLAGQLSGDDRPPAPR